MQKITATLVAPTPEAAFAFEAKMLEALLALPGEYRLSCTYDPPIDSPEQAAITERHLGQLAGHTYTTVRREDTD